jgi:hypothetical protein
MPVSRDFPMARLVIRLLPALAAAALVVPAAIAIGQSAPEGRPLLPDLDQATPSGLVVTHVGSGSGRRWRLGFRSAVGNVGDGPLLIEGRRARDQRAMAASQVIQREGAPMEEVPAAGRLRYVRSPDHQHWHLLGFDRYELRRPGGRRALVEDRKSGFCLGDRYPVSAAPPTRAPQPVFTSRCGLQRPGLLGIREGISVGYGDDYAANLEGQYLRLSGLRGGRYLLVHRANADRRLLEASFANNASSLLLRLRWRRGTPRIRVLAVCPDSARCAVSR